MTEITDCLDTSHYKNYLLGIALRKQSLWKRFWRHLRPAGFLCRYNCAEKNQKLLLLQEFNITPITFFKLLLRLVILGYVIILFREKISAIIMLLDGIGLMRAAK